ncbi:MAG: hypothetical protein M3P85_09655 [Actinomycetota bacterium]|nr:hypothetical protein [Actinomycetota bacterium]
MIDGFPGQPTIVPGDDVALHVSTDARLFCVDFYRCGAGMELMGRSPWMVGRHLPNHLPYQDWAQNNLGLHGEDLEGWPAYRFPIPEHWKSGPYVAIFVEGDENGNELRRPDAPTPDARHSKALFVVKSATPGATASMLYKLPLLTYHAYNRCSRLGYDPATRQGGWSLYTVPRPDHLPAPVPPAVSVHRPGGGTGGTPSDIANFDPFDPTPRQTFAHWDAPFISWLERNGYSVDYCTDLDVHDHAGRELLRRYRLLISVGHDEYWSDAMRENVERFVGEGGNVAFFGGNTCWWRVTFDDQLSFRRVATWSEAGSPNHPENSLTGVSFRNGGERDLDDHPLPVGYQVQHADHWLYEGTGLRDGETFGDRPGEYIVGYECDGADFDRSALERGQRVHPTGNDGTPESFVILGIGDVAPSGWGTGNRAATMGLHSNNGTVFTAATTDWARLLAGEPHPVVEQITGNVLDHLATTGSKGDGSRPPPRRGAGGD